MAGKGSFLQNGVAFRFMADKAAPRCAENLNTFVSKPHFKLCRVSPINQLTLGPYDFPVLVFLTPGELFQQRIWTAGTRCQDTFIM